MIHRAKISSLFVFFLFLLISSDALRRNLKRSTLVQDMCFEFSLKKRRAPLQKTLNLINLLSYQKAEMRKEKVFTSFHQKSATKLIAMTEEIMENTSKNESEKSNKTMISVYLKNKYNSQYLGEIGIGREKQTFSVIFDTGSSDILINSKICLTEACENGRQYKGQNHFPYMKEFVYGSGEIVGMLSKADFFLGKSAFKDVFFFEILAEDEMISDLDGLEGIVGMGFEYDSPLPVFLDYVVKERKVPPIFGVYLNKEADSKKSKITFGGFDKKLFEGKPKYFDVTDPFYWAIDLEGIIVGDKDTGLCSKSNKCKAIIDTGTTFLASSTLNVLQIASLIEVEGNCANFEELPDIKFIFDGETFSIGPKEYLLTLTDYGLDPVYEHSDQSAILQCVGAFTGIDFSGLDNYYILGDLFLTNYYSIFDKKNNRIGLAKAKVN